MNILINFGSWSYTSQFYTESKMCEVSHWSDPKPTRISWLTGNHRLNSNKIDHVNLPNALGMLSPSGCQWYSGLHDDLEIQRRIEVIHKS